MVVGGGGMSFGGKMKVRGKVNVRIRGNVQYIPLDIGLSKHRPKKHISTLLYRVR